MPSFYSETSHLTFDQLLLKTQNTAQKLNYSWTKSATVVLRYSFREDLSPNFRGKDAIESWVKAYFGDYHNRPSVRNANQSKTVNDSILDEIIGSHMSNLDRLSLRAINDAHRLAMASENILGVLLEEYLDSKLSSYGWHCAWGSTIKAVDFVSNEGVLLQVKSRNNTENSSSNKIRKGTTIKKWWRFHSTKGTTNWEQLNESLGLDILSETDFLEFVRKVSETNKDMLAIETENLWLNYKVQAVNHS
ncbi:Type II restriction enzyme [Vibrio crassostreae]|nr:Type II restriction enzyme [Vibrio crassostreae]CAK3768367.1 Type II restriction enzyme [Vibrio crassostreae]CAK3782111.1 Type II restriction enzyme [Vibrio crassostreae]